MSSNNLVSVLVTFYNQENYVDTALNSIISQRCSFNIKILVGDDGSTDRTISKIQSWQEKYPDTIYLYQMERKPGKKYIGGFRASQNRLNLLSHVDTPYFIFLDGDDYFSDSDKLEKQVKVLTDFNNRDCIACAHSIEKLTPGTGSVIVPDQNLPEGKYSFTRYWANLYFHTDTILCRRDVIDSIDFDLVMNHFNDNFITFLILQKGDIYYLKDCMAVYLQTGDGIWTGEKAVINHLRNIMLYDLALMINPNGTGLSQIKFAPSWKAIYDNRKNLGSVNLELLKNEASEKQLECTGLWLKYPNSTNIEKIRVLKKHFFIQLKYMCFRIVRKAKRIKNGKS